VIGIDPDPARRAMAAILGVHHTLASPAADAIKDMTGGKGADICIEVSGAAPALADAIRSVAYASRVVAMGFYQGEIAGLRLGDEFHHNRIELISSQISGVAPAASHRWSKPRLWRTAVQLQHDRMLDLLPLITHTAPFQEAPTLFEQLDAGAPGMLQTMLVF
jgi:threonine dehydrogenase-like Zn-dependent dehydrogenase